MNTFLTRHCPKLYQRRLFELGWAFLVAFLILGLAASGLSPFFKTDYSWNSIDTNFFMMTGRDVLAGKTPYLDFYDHKGVYVFYFNAFMVLLGGRSGVFIVELLVLTYSFFMLAECLRILDLDLGPLLFVGGLLGVATMMAPNGDSIGALISPFLLTPMAVLLQGLKTKNSKLFFTANLLNGLGFAIAFCTRIIDAIPCAAFVLIYIVYGIKKREDIKILWNALGFLAVFALGVAPAFIASSLGHFTSEMLFASFVHNFVYDGRPLHVDELLRRIVSGLVFFGIALTAFLKRKSLSEERFIFLFVGALTMLVTYPVVVRYAQHLISALPFVLVVIALLFNALLQFKHAKITQRIVLSASILGAIASLVNFTLVPRLDPVRKAYAEAGAVASSYIVSRYGQGHFRDGGEPSIFALDCTSALYLDTGYLSNYPYQSFQCWWSLSEPDILQKTKDYVGSKDADIIVIYGTETYHYQPDPIDPGLLQIVQDNYVHVDAASTPGWIEVYALTLA